MGKNKNPSAAIFCALLVIWAACKEASTDHNTWRQYNGGADNTKYSSLTQIDTANVANLQVAWEYHTGDVDTASHSQIQCNPIIIDSILYGTTPQLKLFAVHAATGKLLWRFDPSDPDNTGRSNISGLALNSCRGVAYWTDHKSDQRIFYTAGSLLYCVNAVNGKLVQSFGKGGSIDLHDGLGRDVQDLFVTATSPGMIYKDLIIVGTKVDEGAAAAPGHIRAYNVLTGRQQWIFHTIPQPGEPGYETWDDTAAYRHIGGANCWSGFSLEEKRGLVFAPTGSASFDFYGGKRTGNNLYADCLLALDAATGKLKWHFQEIHHDVWDKDLPAPPSLVTIVKDGKKIEAVAQTTKTGFVFVLDRETGKPVFPMSEKSVPVNTLLPGEKLSPTQPFPSLPEAFVRQTFTEADINDLLPDSSYNAVKKRFQGYLSGNMFNPPSEQGTIILPGFDGGSEWGGPAYDPATGILYVNANEMAWVLQMVPLKKQQPVTEQYADAGKRLFITNCMSCHGADMKGTGNNPSLTGANRKYDADAFIHLVSSGRRMMPAFKQLTIQEQEALASYVLHIDSLSRKPFKAVLQEKDAYLNMPYTTNGYNKFLSSEGYPAIKPPWGTLNAINLNTGKIVWKVPLGEDAAFMQPGMPATGTENYGAPVVTAGGLVFIAATKDGRIRAFNKRTGDVLWQYQLPAAGYATPSLYSFNNRQYLVIACGGGKLKTASGDSYVAFALPDK